MNLDTENEEEREDVSETGVKRAEKFPEVARIFRTEISNYKT